MKQEPTGGASGGANGSYVLQTVDASEGVLGLDQMFSLHAQRTQRAQRTQCAQRNALEDV